MGKIFSLISTLFFVVIGTYAGEPARYEYWFDNDYTAKTTGAVSSGTNIYDIDLSGIRKGLHRFNYRMMTGEGVWGAPFTSFFYSESNAARFTEYEYWLDDNFANRVKGDATGNPVSFNVDLSGFDKSGSAHYFNLRTRDGDGEWSPIYHKLIIFNDVDKRVPVIGYRHFLDGTDLGYVEVERQLVDSYMFDVHLPDSLRPRIGKLKPKFDGDKVSIAGNDSVTYTIQVQTELDWVPPVQWMTVLKNNFSTNAVAMEVNSRHTFEMPPYLGFAAMKFTAADAPLYFRTDTLLALDIYRAGEIVAQIAPEDLKKMTMLSLEAGDYYGILYTDKEPETKSFTLHLMDTPNVVPTPEIKFEEGLVTITCNRKDAQIRYTLDGSEPTSESQLYTDPFELRRNTTIKAKGFVPESDIEPSDLVELVVDSYKTATPTGTFDAASRTLIITCATEGASILYTFDREGEWTPYTGPVAITRNCVVYARASFEGYNDSEVAEIAVTELADNVAPPVIKFENGTVTITCANSDAEIRYTVNGTDPTTESTLYEGPFRLDRNATVKAFAYIPGLSIPPSDIVTLTVDSYRTANPTGKFDVASRTLTITCATEGASISYTFDREGEWTPYTGPVAITRNCVVYARASFEGYSDSEVAEIAVTELADNVAPPVIKFEDGTVTITCANGDAEIRYTVDGTDPTAESKLYEGPFRLNRNATVKAFAYIPGLSIAPSDIVTLTVDSYKTATPTGTFDAASRTLTISCATEGASILYTFDREGEWIPYTGPVAITRNCVVYARATFEGFNDSDVAEIAVIELADNVAPPVIRFEDGTVTISCANGDAEIRYTVDGTDPTAESTLYDAPFRLDRNATVKAFAYIPGLSIAPSDIVTLTVDSYKTATPAGTFNSSTRLLTITCATEGATILYTFDREGEWTPYTEPIAIDGNVTVYAKATRDGYNDSDIAEIVISDMKCAGVSFSYNGRYLRIETGEPEASIRYTTDGTEPSVGMEYSGEFDAEGLCTIRAVAVKPGYMNSDVTEFAINRYADEEHAETSAGGLLASAFEWDDSDLPNSVETFRVEGRLNEADYRFIRSMEALRHLDIEKVVDAHIPEYAFRNTRLISISLPAEITEYGDSILAETPTLSSVIWNSGNIDVKEGLTQSLANPNVLLYVPAEASVSDPSGLNIIKDGIDASVTLHYGHPYYAARDFHAGRVSLTHEFLQTTRVDTCRGWETIVLPFTPTGMTHEVNGPIVPFAVWNEDVNGDKPFWLYSSTENGWEAGSSIQACVPYIISMPNNPDYVSEFNLGGKVTFSAEDVDLGPDSSFAESCPWVEGTRFEGTFMPVEETGLLSLNVNAPEDPYMQPGSAFVPDATTVPFGAYVRGATGRRAMPLFGDGSGVSLPTVTDSGLVVETPAPGMLRISGTRECNVTVTTVTGVTIRTLRLQPGETVILEGLTRDLYIVAGRKVMVR